MTKTVVVTNSKGITFVVQLTPFNELLPLVNEFLCHVVISNKLLEAEECENPRPETEICGGTQQ